MARLVVDFPVITAADPLGLRLPPGAGVSRLLPGWRRVTPSRAAETVGFAPWMPGLLPAGRHRAYVAVHPAPRSDGDDRESVTVTYRRGIDVLWVTTTVPGRSGALSDPLNDGASGGPQKLGDVTISVAPGGLPHLFAVRDGKVMTASGDVTGDDLVTPGPDSPLPGRRVQPDRSLSVDGPLGEASDLRPGRRWGRARRPRSGSITRKLKLSSRYSLTLSAVWSR